MSAIAALFNVPSTTNELNDWAFAHAAHHRDINRTVQMLTGKELPEYILDPINPKDMGVWLYQHQDLHFQTDNVLGIAANDLLDVDWEDRNQLAGWIFLNSNEHYQAANILGIG